MTGLRGLSRGKDDELALIGDVLPLFTRLPRRRVLGNSYSLTKRVTHLLPCVARCVYVTEVAKAANGMISKVAIELPSH